MAKSQVTDIEVGRAVRRRKQETAAQDVALGQVADTFRVDPKTGTETVDPPGKSIFDV